MIVRLFLLIFLITINGIFSASELAFLSLDKIKLKEDIRKRDKKAIKINKVLSNKSTFLSTIQISITFAGFLASAFAADYFVEYFLDFVNISFISVNATKNILVVLITIILSYFTLIFGELVPKKIAINNPYKISRMFIDLVIITGYLFYPFIKILTVSTDFICKVLRIKGKDDKLTEEDIQKLILLGKEEGVIEEKEQEYILNIFEFNDIPVEKVMTPKEKVVMINAKSSIKNILLKVKETKYTRYPVYENEKSNIIGILNIKDLIISKGETEDIDIKNLIRPVKHFNHNKKIDDVFRYMQEKSESICLVYKDKKFVGLVTVEDAIEEIVGNIYDEFDKAKKY